MPDPTPDRQWPVQTIIGVIMTLLLTGTLSWATSTMTRANERGERLEREIAVMRSELDYIKRDVSEIRTQLREPARR